RGRVEIDAYLLGDNRFAPAEAHAESFVFLGPRMKFTGEVVQERDRRGISLYGELVSDDGPLVDATIQAEVATSSGSYEAVGELSTEEDGRFFGFIPADRVPPGEVRLRLAFVPDAGASLRSK